ncbi:MAG: hypothetical protein DHS20C18_35930 [Saprospiraceae bacterium]|nr:MAG: hypothetical protein DHS20C18_35930 [Saprospiraceae bacterium]
MEMVKNIERLKSDYKVAESRTTFKYPFYLKFVQFFFQVGGRIFPSFAANLAFRLFSTPRKRAVHKVSDEWMESARVFEFLYGRELLKGYEWGQGSRTILLVHGWESRGTAMRTFVPYLLEQGFRVVTFDGPAHGHSAGRRTNLPHFAGAVKAIINQIGQVHSIIAHSFGGPVTVFALGRIDPSIRIKKLILIGSPDQLEQAVIETKETLHLPPLVYKKFISKIEKILGVPINQVNVNNSSLSVMVDEVFVVHDEQDDIVPVQSAYRIFEHWKNASLLLSKGYGHYLLMKNPDLLKRVTQFIIR